MCVCACVFVCVCVRACVCRWVPDEDLFVLGANAVLELGPGGGNLMGAMCGGRIIGNELHDLMWKPPDGKKADTARPTFSNMYASLLGEESEDVSSDEEEEVDVSDIPLRAIATPPPKSKAAKKESKNRKHTKARKGKRGM